MIDRRLPAFKRRDDPINRLVVVGNGGCLTQAIADCDDHVPAHIARAMCDVKRVPELKLDDLVTEAHRLEIATRRDEALAIGWHIPWRAGIERTAHDTAMAPRSVQEVRAIQRKDDVRDLKMMAPYMELRFGGIRIQENEIPELELVELDRTALGRLLIRIAPQIDAEHAIEHLDEPGAVVAKWRLPTPKVGYAYQRPPRPCA
jgi:hypothetical protein